MMNYNALRKFEIRKYSIVIVGFALTAWLFLTLVGTLGFESSATRQGPEGQEISPVQTSDSYTPFNLLTEEEWAWLREHPVIRVAQDPSWPPVEFADEQGNPSGMANDYLTLIEQRLGITFERVRNLSWQESYSRLKRWEIDMTTSVTFTPERAEFWAFTQPYMKVPLIILTPIDVTYIADMRELAGKKIAVVEGYIASELIPQDYPDIELIQVKSVIEGLELLQNRSVFALIDNMLVISYYLTQMELYNLKIAGDTPYMNEQSMAVRKDWAILAGILDKVLDSISETERQAIYYQWIPIRYEQSFNYRWLWKLLAVFLVILAGFMVRNWKLSREIRYRKKIEAALRASEEKFRLLFKLVPIPLSYYNKEGEFNYFNERFSHLFGYTLEDIPTIKEWWQRAYPDETYRQWVIETWDSAIAKAAHEGTDIEPIEYRVTCKDGTVRIVEISGICMGGHYLATFLDFTERKRAEEALRESEKRFLTLLQNIPSVAVQSYDLEGITHYWNYASERLYGYSAQEAIGRNLLDLIIPPEMREAVKQDMRRMSIEGVPIPPSELVLMHKDGSRVVVFSSHAVVQIPGRSPELFCLDIDMTERKQAEEERNFLREQLIQAQKMESVGRLAGGVAHDFNNMLGVILGHAEMVLNKLHPSDSIHDSLQEIQTAAWRSADLTRQLLAFARKQMVTPKVLNLNDTVSGMLKMLRRLIGEDLELIWIPADNLWPIRVDPSQIDQILANLAVNARDAIQGVGSLTIETRNVVCKKEDFIDSADFIPGEYVLLSVSDTGCGMDSETQEHIFEPFFTTKGLGEGTGLGLATVYGAVKQNEGFIQLFSTVGQGTTFQLFFPHFRSETVDLLEKPSFLPARGGTETILLVEDEDMILHLGQRRLRELGYTVLAFNSPNQAIRQVQEYPGEIHLLITDVIMPELNGRELHERILVYKPSIRCLFMSGYTANIIAPHGVLNDGMNFMQKPFSLEVLAQKVREVLEK